MNRFWSSLGSIAWFGLAPGLIAGLAPWWIVRDEFQLTLVAADPIRWIGIPLMLVGLAPLVGAFVDFAWYGRGTPAPIAPPSRLVTRGFYRHVRNPMYVGLICILIGEAILAREPRVVVLAVVFWLITHAFVRYYEEPALAARFGVDYAGYRSNVPRWIPRLTAWDR